MSTSLRVILTNGSVLRIPYQPTDTVGIIKKKIVERTAQMRLGDWQTTTRTVDNFHVVDSTGTFLFEEDTLQDLGTPLGEGGDWKVLSALPETEAVGIAQPSVSVTTPLPPTTAVVPPVTVPTPTTTTTTEVEKEVAEAVQEVILRESVADELSATETLERRLLVDSEKTTWRNLISMLDKDVALKWKTCLGEVRMQCVEVMITGDTELIRNEARDVLEIINGVLEDTHSGADRYMWAVETYNHRMAAKGTGAAVKPPPTDSKDPAISPDMAKQLE
eukprot:PhF_6_TR20455/c0_g1_i2/m.29390